MLDFMLFMHDDAKSNQTKDASDAWRLYIESLKTKGVFQGGSSIGTGICKNSAGSNKTITSQLVGYIRIRADSLKQAEEILSGNPVFEAGGTVEIRELPRA